MNIDTSSPEAPTAGLCGCGCSMRVPIAKRTRRRLGHVKGQPLRFINGHNSRVQRGLSGEWFWEKVDRTTTPDGCWPFTGYRNKAGYGYIRINGRYRPATHVALELAGWIIPFAGLQVLHKCDNPPCVRPDHLRIGTSQDDADDKVSKGRQTWGERNSQAKLDQGRVQEILALYEPGIRGRGYRALARQFGVHPSNIKTIVCGKTWRRS